VIVHIQAILELKIVDSNYFQLFSHFYFLLLLFSFWNLGLVSQISYSLVVILELSGVLEVQYKEIMMSSINKNNVMKHFGH